MSDEIVWDDDIVWDDEQPSEEVAWDDEEPDSQASTNSLMQSIEDGIKQLGLGVVNSPAAFGTSAAKFGRQVTEPLSPIIGDTIPDFFERTANTGDLLQQQYRQAVDPGNSMAFDVGSSMGQMGLALPMAPSAIAPAVVMGAQASGSKYDELRDKGVGEIGSQVGGLVKGSTEAALERLPIKFIKNNPLAESATDGFIKSAAKKTIGAGLSEAGEEVISDVGVDTAIDYAATGEVPSLDELGERAYRSAIVGGAAGAGLATATTGVQAVGKTIETVKNNKTFGKSPAQMIEADAPKTTKVPRVNFETIDKAEGVEVKEPKSKEYEASLDQVVPDFQKPKTLFDKILELSTDAERAKSIINRELNNERAFAYDAYKKAKKITGVEPLPQDDYIRLQENAAGSMGRVYKIMTKGFQNEAGETISRPVEEMIARPLAANPGRETELIKKFTARAAAKRTLVEGEKRLKEAMEKRFNPYRKILAKKMSQKEGKELLQLEKTIKKNKALINKKSEQIAKLNSRDNRIQSDRFKDEGQAEVLRLEKQLMEQYGEYDNAKELQKEIDRLTTKKNERLSSSAKIQVAKLQKQIKNIESRNSKLQERIEKQIEDRRKQVGERLSKRKEKLTMEAEGTIVSPITGVSARLMNDPEVEGIVTDVQAARKALADFEGDPDTEVLDEMESTYQFVASKSLGRLRENGIISEDHYRNMMQNQDSYVSLARVIEDYTGEPLDQIVRSTMNEGGAFKAMQSFEGSTKDIKGGYRELFALIERSEKIVADNKAKKAFFQSLQSEDPQEQAELRGIALRVDDSPEGRMNQLLLSNEKFDVNGEQATKNKVSYWDNGQKVTYFIPDNDIAKSFNNILKLPDGFVGGALRFLKAIPDLKKELITIMPDFLIRNTARDIGGRVVMSETQELFNIPQDVKKSFTKEDWQRINNEVGDLTTEDYYFEGGGFAGYQAINEMNYYKLMRDSINRSRANTKDSLFLLAPSEALAKGKQAYRETRQLSEDFVRMKEFRSAYKYGRTVLNYDAKNAKIFAANEARKLMDFSKQGRLVKIINWFSPFFAPAIRGKVRNLEAIKKHGFLTGYAYRVGAATVLPTILERFYAYVSGTEEEHWKLPGWRKDFFYNLKVADSGPVQWVSWPKPFDVGLVGSLTGRAIDATRGNSHPFSDVYGLLNTELLPAEGVEKVALNGFSSFVDVWTNSRSFKGGTIVPPWDVGKDLDVRNTPEYLSPFAKGWQWVFEETGLGETEFGRTWGDARVVEHFVGEQFGNFGKSLVEVGRIKNAEDAMRIFLKRSSGLVRGDEFLRYTDDVNAVTDFVRRRGLASRSKARKFSELLKQHDLMQAGPQQDALRERILVEAKQLRREIDEKKDAAFPKARR